MAPVLLIKQVIERNERRPAGRHCKASITLSHFNSRAHRSTDREIVNETSIRVDLGAIWWQRPKRNTAIEHIDQPATHT